MPPERRIKAYKYGQEKVPFSAADIESFKLGSERSLKVLGFLPKSELNRTSVSWIFMSPVVFADMTDAFDPWCGGLVSKFVGGTDVFVAEPDKPFAHQSLAALVKAMLETDNVVIARFVPRKNASPKVIAMSPREFLVTSSVFLARKCCVCFRQN